MILMRILIAVTALLPFSGAVQAGLWDNFQGYFSKPAISTPPIIRVLIVNDKPGAVVEVKGRYQIYDPHDNSHISSRLAGKRNFMQAISGGLKWGEEFPGVHQIMIVPDSLMTPVTIDGVDYRGTLYIYDIGGSISIVNEVYIEDYITSLMSTAFPNPVPDEALAAVAITLRTNALYQSQNPRTKYWDVDANVVGYHGYVVADGDSPVDRAIHDTHYMIISTTGVYERSTTPIPAQWNGLMIGKGLNEKLVVGKVTLDEASEMARKGDHAAQILAKAFPGTTIQLVHTLTEKSVAKGNQ